MTLKSLWDKTGSWLRTGKLARLRDYQPQINDDGLISPEVESPEHDAGEKARERKQALVKTVPPTDKTQSLEKLQEGFNRLIEQLQGINEHLNRQVAQNEDLMGRVEQLPKLLESFPAVVENQKRLTEQLFEQLKSSASKEERFLEAVEKIPTETGKQTDALTGIDQQLAAAADIDVQMAEGFNKFNETLDKLNQSTVGQTDGIMQMSKTFATSDRYLKYIMSKQHKRFIWVFIIAMGVCVLAILILTGVIIYLSQ